MARFLGRPIDVYTAPFGLPGHFTFFGIVNKNLIFFKLPVLCIFDKSLRVTFFQFHRGVFIELISY